MTSKPVLAKASGAGSPFPILDPSVPNVAAVLTEPVEGSGFPDDGGVEGVGFEGNEVGEVVTGGRDGSGEVTGGSSEGGVVGDGDDSGGVVDVWDVEGGTEESVWQALGSQLSWRP